MNEIARAPVSAEPVRRDPTRNGSLRTEAVRAWLARTGGAAMVPGPLRLWEGTQEVASEITRGVYRITHHAPAELAAPITWEEDPFGDRNWRLWFHSLAAVSYLVQAAEESAGPELRAQRAGYLLKARNLVDSWIRQHIDGSARHEMTWHDHAVALRVMVLLHFGEAWRRHLHDAPESGRNGLPADPEDFAFAERLLHAIERHGVLLTDPAIYRKAHNHGVDQDRALMAIAVLTPELPKAGVWERLARRRLAAQIRVGISTEGVHFEQSPEYEGLIFLMLSELEIFLAAHHRAMEAVSQAARGLLRKITFSIKPDGRWAPLGDTTARRPEELRRHILENNIDAPEVLWALSGGNQGRPPEQNHLILPASGCMVFRNSWTAPPDESVYGYFTAAFNTRTHKHKDDLSFALYAYGQDILVDGGRYSYNYDDVYRKYCESVFAHNVVIVDGKDTETRRLNIGKSGLVAEFESSDLVAAEGVHYLYPGVEVRRLLVYLPPGLIVVIDRVLSMAPVSAVQQFLLAPELSVEQAGSLVRGSAANGAGVHLVQVLHEGSDIELVRGARGPTRGWVSRAHGRVEACTAVSTSAQGMRPVFATAILLQREFDPATPIEAHATREGLTISCTIEAGSLRETLSYACFANEAVLECRGRHVAALRTTAYEARTGEKLRIAPVGTRAGTEVTVPTASQTEPQWADTPTLRTRMARDEARLALLQRQLLRAEEHLAAELAARDRELGALRVQLGELEERLGGRLRTEMERIEGRMERERRRGAVAERRIHELRAEQRALTGEKERLAREIEEAAERLKVQTAKVAQLTEFASSRKTRCAKLENERDELRAELAKARRQASEAQKAELELRNRLQETRRELTEARRKYRVKCEQAREAVQSFRWRAGDALARAAHPSLDTLKLPVRLAKLYLDARRKERGLRTLPARLKLTDGAPGNGRPARPALANGSQAQLNPLAAEARAAETGPRPKSGAPLRVACILDEFSHECFAPEADFLQLSPETWQSEIEQHQPAFLFVESAWKGKGEQWRHMVASAAGKERGPLPDLVQHCRKRGIPTVFWNKEDPANFEHFKNAAALFDVIFTTDADCLERYRALSGHDRCYALPFAAQSRIHNPIGRNGGELGDVCFAGTWYAQKHDGRREDAEIILEPALEFGLHIYDRMHFYTGPGWQNYQYPPKYEGAIRGGLPYQEMLETYKKYHVFMNVNSVRNSPTMCARRVFEILACGTGVVSSYAPAIENLLPGCVFLSRSAEETRAHLKAALGDAALRNRMCVSALRTVFGRHTYVHRFAAILEAVGLGKAPADPLVSVVVPVETAEDVARAREFLAAQRYASIEPVWVAPAGLVAPATDQVVVESGGDGVATAMKRAGGEFLMTWRRETPASGTLVEDLVRAFTYYDGDAVGKPEGAADTLVFREVRSLPLARTMLRRDVAQHWGAPALTNQAAFDSAAAGARLLATDTVIETTSGARIR